MAKSVIVNFIADASRLKRGTDEATRKIDGLKGKLGGLGKTLGFALGGAAILKFGKDSVKAFGESETAAALMATSLKNNKQLAGASIGTFQKLASALQAKTAADDESILSGAAVLGNFKLTQDQIKNTLPLVVDYARATGKDVPTAAQDVGKALLGNAKALKNLGIVFKPTGDAAKDFASVTQLVRDKVGGFASKEAATSAGKMEILKNRFNDLQEVVGGKLVAAFKFLTDHIAIIGPIIVSLVSGIVAYKVATGIAAVVTALFGETAAAAWLAAAGPIALVVAGVVGLGLVVWKFRDKFVGAFRAVVDFLKRFWPILLPVLLGPIGLAIVAFVKHKDKIIGVFRSLVGGIKSVFGSVAGFIGGVFDAVLSVIRGALNIVISVINGMIRAYNVLPFHKDIKTIGHIGASKSVVGDAGAGAGIGHGIPAFASGGVMPGPRGAAGLAILHGGERVTPAGSSGVIELHVHIGTREIVREIRSELLNTKRSNVNLGLA